MALGGPVICPHCGKNILSLPTGRASLEDVKAAMERFIKEQEELREPKLEHPN